MQIMRLSGPPQHATFYKTAVRAHRRARQLSRRQTAATCGPTITTVLEQIDHIARTTFAAFLAVEVFLIRKGNYEKEQQQRQAAMEAAEAAETRAKLRERR